MIKPIVVIVTSKTCPHCIHFRGDDGKPTDDKQWSPKLIKKILTGVENPTTIENLKSEIVIEIHLSNMNIPSDNIIQVNEYNLINNNGISLRRIIYTRRKNDIISIDVEIDGILHPELSKSKKNSYYEEQLPIQCYKLFLGDFDVLNEEPENDFVNEIFVEAYEILNEALVNLDSGKSDDFNSRLDSLFESKFNFKWWLSNNIPNKLQYLVSSFPSWIYISPILWYNSIVYDSPLYGVVNSSTVTKHQDGTYSADRDNNEDPFVTLNKINIGEYSLTNY